jgi:hypothetical protein
MASDNTLLVLGLGGLGLWWLYDQDKKAKAAALAAAQGPTPFTPAAQPLPSIPVTPQNVSPLNAIVPAATKLGNEILPGAGLVVGAVANTEVSAVKQIISGNITPLNIAEVAFFPVAVTATAINAIADLFGWSGKPLDAVNDVLLQAYSSPPVGNNNVQTAMPIYALDSQGVLHQVLPPDVNTADFSWREIIAVRQSVIDGLPKGAAITNRNQITTMPRPLDGTALRTALGPSITFKLGNVNDLHTPAEVGLTFNPTLGWLTQAELDAYRAQWARAGF